MTQSRLTRPFFILAGDRTNLSIFSLAAGSWIVLAAWSSSPYSIYLGHSELGGISNAAALLPLASLFFAGWLLMISAMMLPSTFPLVTEFRKRTVVNALGRHHIAALVAGGIVVWAPFGIMIYLADVGIHRIAEVPPIHGNEWVLGLSSLTLVGAYQFTSAKSSFLKDCCFPSDFLQSRLRGELTERRIFRIGLDYGKASMGSHWGLMLLMFSLGLGSVLWMLPLGLAVGAEHEQRIGPKVRIPIGVAIFVSALWFGFMYGRI